MSCDAVDDADPQRPRPAAGGALRVFLWLWFPLLLVPTASLMAAHLITLPAPASVDPVLVAAVVASRPADARGLFALHVVLGECRCSGRVLQRLRARGPRADVRERILLVEASEALVAETRSSGWDVLALSRQELHERYHLDAAPLLVLMNASDGIAYLGGYTGRKGSLAIEDVRLEDAVLRGEVVAPLPLYGCAIDRQLERDLDPLGLRTIAKRETP